MNTDLINTEYLSGGTRFVQTSRIHHFCYRGRIESTCSSSHCRVDIPNITVTFLPTAPPLCLKSSLLIHIDLEGLGIWNIITMGRSPCHAGVDFLPAKELGVKTRWEQHPQTKLNCSKSYPRLKYKQGNRRGTSALRRSFSTGLPVADLQIWSTRIFVGNTQILQSFTATASPCAALRFNGADLEHSWLPCRAPECSNPRLKVTVPRCALTLLHLHILFLTQKVKSLPAGCLPPQTHNACRKITPRSCLL